MAPRCARAVCWGVHVCLTLVVALQQLPPGADADAPFAKEGSCGEAMRSYYLPNDVYFAHSEL